MLRMPLNDSIIVIIVMNVLMYSHNLIYYDLYNIIYNLILFACAVHHVYSVHLNIICFMCSCFCSVFFLSLSQAQGGACASSLFSRS